MEIFKVLRKTSLFAQIDDQMITRMISCFGARGTVFEKGQEIVRQGQEIKEIVLLAKGEANAQNEDLFGNISIILNLSSGDFFGVEEAYAEESCFKDSLVSTEQSLVVFFNKDKLLSPCSNNCLCHQMLIKRLVKIISSRSLALTDKIKHLSQRGIRDKVLSYLQTQSRHSNSRYFDIPFNKTELANYLAVERSALSSVLSKLKKEGIIDFEKKKYFLKNIKD